MMIKHPGSGANMKTSVIIFCLVLIVITCSCRQSSSEEFPQKNITLIVYTGPGGLIDGTARKFVDIASKYTDATFVVENKPGSGGIIALKNLLQQPADGYTLMASTKSNISKIVSTGADEFIEDIHWAAMLMADPECVITCTDNGITSWQDILSDAGRNDKKQIWLGPANGGLDHVTALKIWEKAGINAKWIPYKSGGKARAALLGNQGAAYVGNPREVLGNDKLRIAAVSAKSRLPQFPEVPTFKELGLEGLENEFMWRGFIFKKGTPEHVQSWYNNLFLQVNADPEWRNYWEKGGIEVNYTAEEKFSRIVLQDKKDFSHYLSGLGILQTPGSSVMGKVAQGSITGILAALMALSIILLSILGKKSTRSWYRGLIIPLFFIFTAILFLLKTYTFPSNEEVGPQIIPRLWIFLLIPLNLISVWKTRQQKQSKKMKSGSKTVMKFILLLVLYLCGIYLIGYFPSTLFFLLAGFRLLGYKKLSATLLITVGWLLFSWFIFYKMLFVPLPEGILTSALF